MPVGFFICSNGRAAFPPPGKSNMVEKQSSNSKGGKRPGAGRKKGAPNRRTVETQAQAEETGQTPLEYMLYVMRNSGDERLRMSAAQAAAPYVHAKLASIELTGKDGGPLEVVGMTKEQRDAAVAAAGRADA